jgi:NAD(P)-dependent dehydrogenase (short-subunit alcohol dehydrogenase family)
LLPRPSCGRCARPLAYGQSKTATALFAAGITRWAEDGNLSNALHPSAIATCLQKHTGGLKTPEQGARDVDPSRAAAEGLGGLYFEDCNEAMRGDTSRVGAGFGDPMRLGASDNEGVKLWIGYGAIYVQGGQQS